MRYAAENINGLTMEEVLLMVGVDHSSVSWIVNLAPPGVHQTGIYRITKRKYCCLLIFQKMAATGNAEGSYAELKS